MALRLLLILAVLVWAPGCQHRSATSAASAAGADADIDAILGAAYEAVNGGRCAQVADITAPAVRRLEAIQARSEVRALRTPEDSLAEAMMSALSGADVGEAGGSVVVLSSAWADIFYLRGFCEIEAKRMERAIVELERGLAVLPGDVLLTVERGHAEQMLGRHTEAMASFHAALEDVNRLSSLQSSGWAINGRDLRWWHGRCLRGVGYSQIELGLLNDAEQTYLQALAVDPDDQQARNELGYILQLRAQKGTPKGVQP